MAFEKLVCTEALFQELALPETLRSLAFGGGGSILYDKDRQAVIMLEPMHYAAYPDYSFVLCIGGKNQKTGWVRPDSHNSTTLITIQADEIGVMSDVDFLAALLRDVWPGEGYEIDIRPHKSHVSPQENCIPPYDHGALVAKLNKLASIALPALNPVTEIEITLYRMYLRNEFCGQPRLSLFLERARSQHWQGLSEESLEFLKQLDILKIKTQKRPKKKTKPHADRVLRKQRL